MVRKEEKKRYSVVRNSFLPQEILKMFKYKSARKRFQLDASAVLDGVNRPSGRTVGVFS